MELDRRTGAIFVKQTATPDDRKFLALLLGDWAEEEQAAGYALLIEGDAVNEPIIRFSHTAGPASDVERLYERAIGYVLRSGGAVEKMMFGGDTLTF